MVDTGKGVTTAEIWRARVQYCGVLASMRLSVETVIRLVAIQQAVQQTMQKAVRKAVQRALPQTVLSR